MGEVTAEYALAAEICGCATREQRKGDIEAVCRYRDKVLTAAQAENEALKARVAELEAQVAADRDTFRDADILDDPIGAAAQLEAGYRNCCATLTETQP